MEKTKSNPKINIQIDSARTAQAFDAVRDAYALLSKLDRDCLGQFCNILLEFLNNSVDFNKVFCINTYNSTGGAGNQLISFDLTDSGCYFLTAVRAFEGGGIAVNKTHKISITNGNLGPVNSGQVDLQIKNLYENILKMPALV
jgi:hypothetical protein